MFENTINNIVLKHGGYREKEIWSNPHTIEKSETWNNDHRVLCIISTERYCHSFAVDIVTMSIVG